ncbi:GNAT family N-acetyltransferase [Bacillus sp. FJAT-18017]|uniref:GNAT family N-acetyltransferase n=1 Tax=Bacillus sp. FJAT-18017 TaxID=1705566 RepID=UPI000AB7B4C1|nr:GNAT family N-acetyltransferase [Bacillus sp. FJAT-18017]
MAIKNDVGYPSLETERLTLRILTLDDCGAVFEHFSDRDVTRFMDIEPCKDLKEAKGIIQFHLDDAGCRWGIFEKASKSLIGTVGFHYLRGQGGVAKPEVVYYLSKRYWGNGFMVEAMKKLFHSAFRE